MKLVYCSIAALVSAGILAPDLSRADLRPEKPWRCTESVVTKVGNYFEGDPSFDRNTA